MPRVDIPHTCYHIISRSVSLVDLFRDNSDFRIYLARLRRVKQESDFKVLCYCLMSTHVHLCLETGDGCKLSKIMHRLNTYYAGYYNAKYSINGPVFRNRYQSIFVDKDSYLLRLSRYIHLNPVSAGIVSFPDDYKWSSFKCYIDRSLGDGLIDLQSIAGYFTSPAEYNRFVVSGIRTPDDPFKEVICNNYMGSRQFVANINRRLCMLGLR